MKSSKAIQSSNGSRLCGLKKTHSSTLTTENVDSIVQQADDYLQSLVQKKAFSGSVLLARNSQIILIKGYGYSVLAANEKNTSQTIYRIGSVTKPLTAVIILRLYERKQIDLDAKLSRYYPDYPHGDQITVKHLLSNTSGIEDYTEMEVFEKICQDNLTNDQLIDIFKNEPLKSKPGSEYSYSNSNFILLGWLIEHVSGKSYEANLREFILEPCAMKDTGYECDCQQAIDTGHRKRACGYICSTNADGFETCRFIDMSTARSAGGIYSTIEDLYRFDRYLYDETILRNRTKKLMFKPVKEHYALGWEVHRLKHGRVQQLHTGQIFGFTSCLARFPNDDACIIMLSNLEETSIDDIIEQLTNVLFDSNL